MSAYRLFYFCVLLTGFLLHAAGVVANESSPKENKSTKKTAAVQIVYIPPVRGAPTTRTMSAGTRGSYPHQPLDLLVMASEHTGWTSTDQPVLYWYINQALSVPVEFTLINDEADDPLLEMVLGPMYQVGFHGVSLKDHHIRLQAGIEYQWSVSAVIDAEHRSNDVFASGAIQYHRNPQLKERLASQSGPSVAGLYASNGYWYDAIHALETWIKKRPNDTELQKQKAQLLMQAKLAAVLEITVSHALME